MLRSEIMPASRCVSDHADEHDAKLNVASYKWLNGSCLACDFCQQGYEPLCAKATLSGYTVDGTFQQYCVAKAAHVARLHKDIPLDAVAPVLCAGITVYKGLKESDVRPGQTVAIVGAGGGLGSLACQYAKAMGLRIIAVDAGDEKKEMCQKLGADEFVDFSKSSDVVKDVQAATEDGFGPHAVLLVAVTEKPFQQASEVRPCPHVSQCLTNISEVCPTTRYSHCHWSASRCIPPCPCLPDGYQNGHYQRFLCRKPQGYG